MNDPSPLEAIFFAALEKSSPEERAAYLGEVCADDPELRRRVEKMLAAQATAGSFLEQPARSLVETVDNPLVSEHPGIIIGPYKLLEPIGEGGMGTVWMAQQTEPVKRLVAVKFIRAGMDSRQVIARFEAERQALALMDHPNIARVLDAGTTKGEAGGVSPGRPYFVMDLVKGVPITRYCDEHHLTPRQRLELFIPVCQAIQHAHQKGIIHRDLKPSNVLVALYDGKPVPKVIDFGVAKATGQSLTEKTLVTAFGNLVGTLEYMSPEQAELNQLDIDTRSDIYSLGVLLYELLTGTTPLHRKRLTQAAFVEMLRIIREEEPPRPSTRLSTIEELPTIAANRGLEPHKLNGLVRGELDWIVMKALEKDRKRRYETANAFAKDLQRYLADEPVQACPPSVSYRLTKFIRRNKASVIAVAVTVLALIVGMLGTTFGLFRAVRAERNAVLARNKAQEAEKQEREAKILALRAKKAAETNLAQAIKAAETFFTRVSESKLLDKPALQPFRKELLEEAQKHFRELFSGQKDDPKLKAELAASFLRIVIVLAALDAGEEALRALEQGLDLVEPLVRENPTDVTLARRLVGIWKAERPIYRWSDGFSRGSMATNLPTAARACKVWKDLAEFHPDIPELQAEYATLLLYQGDIHFHQQRLRECQQLYQQADDIFSRLAREQPLSCEYRISATLARAGLAWLLDYGERATGPSLARAREATEMAERLVRDFPDKPIVHVLLLGRDYDLAALLSRASRGQEAVAIANRAIAAGEKLLTADPEVPAYRLLLGDLYARRGGLRELSLRMADAEADFQRARDLAAEAARQSPQDLNLQLVWAIRNRDLARSCYRKNQVDEAVNLLHQAMAMLTKFNDGKPHEPSCYMETGNCHFQLGLIQKNLGQLPEAEKNLRAAVAVQTQLLTEFPTHALFRPDLHSSRMLLIEVFKSRGRPQEADSFVRETLAFWVKLANDNPEKASYQDQLGRTYHDLGFQQKQNGQTDAAEKSFHQAILLWTTLAKLYPEDGQSWHMRGIAYSELLDWDNAIADQTKAIELSPTLWWNWHQRGLCHVQLKHWDAALSDFIKVLELQPNQAPGLVNHLLAFKRNNEAENLLRQGIEVLQETLAHSNDAANLENLGQCLRLLVQLLEKSDRRKDSEAVLSRAIDVLAKLAKEQPATASYRDILARSQYDLGRQQQQDGEAEQGERNIRQAIELWTKLAAEAPAEPAYLRYAVNAFVFELAPRLQETGRVAEAEQFLAGAHTEWIKLVRNDLEQHRNALAEATGLWARLLFNLGKPQQAEQIAVEAVERWPQNAHALIARGKMRLALGSPDKALEDIAKAIQLAPADGLVPWWWLDRSFAHAALKQEDKALADLTEATERWPDLWDAWVWRADFHFDRARWDEAAFNYTEALARNPKFTRAWRNRGATFIHQAHWNRAIEDYDKAIALEPKNADFHRELAWLLAHCPNQKVRNPGRAVELAHRAVVLDPKNGDYHGTLGSALYRAGDWKAALEELNVSIKLRPQQGADMLFLAMAHMRLGQDADARGWYDRANEWVEKNSPKDDELLRFREEARALLKL